VANLAISLVVSRPGACAEALPWIKLALEYESSSAPDAAAVSAQLRTLAPIHAVATALQYWGATVVVTGNVLRVTGVADPVRLNTIVTALINYADDGSWWSFDPSDRYRGIVDSTMPRRHRVIDLMTGQEADPFALD
jgi:hypothetical protein